MKIEPKKNISIIIPIYNQKKFLKRCVDSVIKQTYDVLEILLIDDGSTDESPRICDWYAQIDKRIKVIHQENKGLSGARNTGINNATGDLLMFCDSDDEMLPTMVEALVETMYKTDADIAVCDFIEIFPDERVSEELKTREHIKVSDDEITVAAGNKRLDMIFNLISVVQWNKLFRREIFRTYRYPEGRYHEDEYAVHHEYYAADKVAVIERRLYLYYRHDESISMNPTLKKRIDAIEGLLERSAFFKENGRYRHAFKAYRLFVYFFKEAMDNLDSFDDSQEMLPQMRKIAKREGFKMVLTGTIIRAKRHFLTSLKSCLYKNFRFLSI